MSLRKKRRQCIPIFLRYQQLMGRQCVDYRDGTNGYQPRSLVNKNGYHPAHFGWRSWTPSFGQNGTQRIPSVSTPARSPRAFRSRFGNKRIRSGDDDGRPAHLALLRGDRLRNARNADGPDAPEADLLCASAHRRQPKLRGPAPVPWLFSWRWRFPLSLPFAQIPVWQLPGLPGRSAPASQVRSSRADA